MSDFIKGYPDAETLAYFTQPIPLMSKPKYWLVRLCRLVGVGQSGDVAFEDGTIIKMHSVGGIAYVLDIQTKPQPNSSRRIIKRREV